MTQKEIRAKIDDILGLEEYEEQKHMLLTRDSNDEVIEGVDFSEEVEQLCLLFSHSKVLEEIEGALEKDIGMMRQWLNEDRITDPKKMVTNEEIKSWLTTALEIIKKYKG